MPPCEGGYKYFKIGNLFDIHPTKSYKLTNRDLFVQNGHNPVLTNTSTNNGIGGYTNLPTTEKGNIITFSDTTTSDAIFYQEFPFIGYSHVQGLYPIKYKNSWTKRTLLYIVALFRGVTQGRFDYATKFTRTLAYKMELLLPITRDGEIDFQYIESRMRELEEERMRELEAYLAAAGFANCDLTPEEQDALRKFSNGEVKLCVHNITDTFHVANTHNILKSDIVFGSGKTPYVTASASNNSIVSYISYKPEYIEQGNSIMIGGKTLVITYQPDDFFSNDSHNLILRPKETKGQNESCELFAVAALYKSLAPKYSWGDSISKQKIQVDKVYLPVNQDGQIDYNFMETYISAIKKQIIARLKAEVAREHKAYESVIND